jgi:phage tail-like protein
MKKGGILRNMPETPSDNDRLTPYFFCIEIDGINCARFKKCEGLEIYTDVFEYEEGGYNLSTRKFIGQTHYQNIVLENGVSYNRSLFDWFHYTTLWDNERERKRGSIVLMDSSWNELRRWNFFRAFPCRWVGPSLGTKLGAEYAIEKIEIAYEYLEEVVDENITTVIEESEESVKIRKAFNKLKYSEFGNTPRGREIVKILSETMGAGRITIVPLQGLNAQVVRNPDGSLCIQINKSVPDEAVSGRLAHEGTHLLHLKEHGELTFEEERECFDNAYKVDVELNSPYQFNPIDEWIMESYFRNR